MPQSVPQPLEPGQRSLPVFTHNPDEHQGRQADQGDAGNAVTAFTAFPTRLLANRHGWTPRAVQRLFEVDGKTLTD